MDDQEWVVHIHTSLHLAWLGYIKVRMDWTDATWPEQIIIKMAKWNTIDPNLRTHFSWWSSRTWVSWQSLWGKRVRWVQGLMKRTKKVQMSCPCPCRCWWRWRLRWRWRWQWQGRKRSREKNKVFFAKVATCSWQLAVDWFFHGQSENCNYFLHNNCFQACQLLRPTNRVAEGKWAQASLWYLPNCEGQPPVEVWVEKGGGRVQGDFSVHSPDFQLVLLALEVQLGPVEL